MRAEADGLLREAEKLVTAPSSRLSRLMWKAEPALAAPKFASAANKFAYTGASDLAQLCFERAAQCFASTEQHYSAAQNYEKAFGQAKDVELLLKAGEEFALAGQPLTAAEAISRGAMKIDHEAAMAYVIEYADSAGGNRAVEVARAAAIYLAGKRRFDRAAEAAATVLAMMDAVGIEASEPSRARLVAAVVIIRLFSSFEAAEQAFLDALPAFAPAAEAKFVDDLIAACKSRDLKALKEVLAPPNLSLLDFEIAALARDLPNDLPRRAWWIDRSNSFSQLTSLQPAAVEAQSDDGDDAPSSPLGEVPGDDDDLPDIS